MLTKCALLAGSRYELQGSRGNDSNVRAEVIRQWLHRVEARILRPAVLDLVKRSERNAGRFGKVGKLADRDLREPRLY